MNPKCVSGMNNAPNKARHTATVRRSKKTEDKKK